MTLNPEQQKLIDRLVASGLFDSPDHVIDTALRYLDEHQQKLADLKKEIQRGYDSGSSIPGEKVFAELRQKAIEDINRV
jgi:putative addiction module CopG family antidote